MNIILIILVFGIIIFIHEFGHFLFAKLNHVGVIEFAIGMGPCIYSFTKKETKYSIRILPLGGYCLMVGEDGEDTESENSFGSKSVLARMSIILAGPFFNILLAFVLSIFLTHYTGYDSAKIEIPDVVLDEAGNEIPFESAAKEAGMRSGDVILKIDGGRIYNYREVTLFMAMHTDGDPIDFKVKHADGTVENITVTPRKNEQGEYKIGVVGGARPTTGIGCDIKYGALEVRYWTKATVAGLKMLVTGGAKGGDLMGVVGVGGYMNEVIEEVKDDTHAEAEAAKEEGIAYNERKMVVINIILNLMNWGILLCVNLAIMNLLPIPALDGGRFFFLLIEGVTRKRIPPEKEAIVNFIGFALVIAIMILVCINDIKNVFF